MHYISDKERKILFDALLPDVSTVFRPTALVRLLFARVAENFSFSSEKTVRGYKFYHVATPEKIINDLKHANEWVERTYNHERKSFDTRVKQDLAVALEWERFRLLLAPPERTTISQAFRIGKNIGHTTLMIVREILESGLGIRRGITVNFVSATKAYYPLYVTKDLQVFEVALKKDISRSYTNVIQRDKGLRSYFEKLFI